MLTGNIVADALFMATDPHLYWLASLNKAVQTDDRTRILECLRHLGAPPDDIRRVGDDWLSQAIATAYRPLEVP